MRHAAVTFAEEAAELEADCIWCTDMLDLACWRALAPSQLRDLPHLLYMHENQLLYPMRDGQQPDYHYAVTNLTSMYAADCVVWNSHWHRDAFIEAMQVLMQRMPDHPLSLASVREKSLVCYPGFECSPVLESRNANELPHILWAARWEWEKGPDIFFDALAEIGDETPFTLSVIGGDAGKANKLFTRAEQTWQHRVHQWGYLEQRQDYTALLQQADMVVSSARHEFFGLAMVEACAAGCLPVLPQTLSYPEVFRHVPETQFYDGSSEGLARQLQQCLNIWQHDEQQRQRLHAAMAIYDWQTLLPQWDDAVDKLLP